MSRSIRKTFCVSVMMADYYTAWIEADDHDTALDMTAARWHEDGGDIRFNRSERHSINIVDWEEVI